MTIVANEAFVADYIGTMIHLDFTALTFEIIIANTDAITTLAIQTAIHALAWVTTRSHALAVLTDKVALTDHALTRVATDENTLVIDTDLIDTAEDTTAQRFTIARWCFATFRNNELTTAETLADPRLLSGRT